MRHRHSEVVENVLKLDIFTLNRSRTVLEKGPSQWSGMVEWRVSETLSSILEGRAGKPVATLYLVVDQCGDQFTLELVGLLEGSQRVALTSTPCYFGGVRYWFRCPGADCRRRVAMVYLLPGATVFLCRTCHGLTYRSCQASKSRRRYD